MTSPVQKQEPAGHKKCKRCMKPLHDPEEEELQYCAQCALLMTIRELDKTPEPPPPAQPLAKKHHPALFAVLLCLALSSVGFGGYMAATGWYPFKPELSPEHTPPADVAAQRTIEFVVSTIEDFKSRTGRLPENSAEIEFFDPEEYVYKIYPKDNRYVITVTVDGVTKQYDSSKPRSDIGR